MTASLAVMRRFPAQYVVAKEGGEIWIDYYNIPVGASNPEAAHAWINFVYQPKINGLETSYTYYGSPLKRSLLKGTAAGKLLDGQGGLSACGYRQEARDQPSHGEGNEAPGTDLDGVQGVIAVGFSRS